MEKPALLIVDDEAQFLESISAVLEEEFHVIVALNGREAFSIIKAHPLSLILLDLQMPEITGIELLEKIRNAKNETPVLIITGNSSQDWAEKCADLNVQGYIKKPVDVDNLIMRINKLLCMEDFEVLSGIWNDNYEARMSQLSPVIKNALRFACNNYSKGFDRCGIAAFLEVSPDYLTRQFHKECGLTLNDYINKLRIQKSKELLRDFRQKKISAGCNSCHRTHRDPDVQ